MSSVAIMQPYFLPYIGYFQLISAVDKFIIFDDVSYIKRGWINRNRILLAGQSHMVTLPLNNASQNKAICELSLVSAPLWRRKLLRKVEEAYSKAPHRQEVCVLLESILQFGSDDLSAFLVNSIILVNRSIGISTPLVHSSRVYENSQLKGESRIIDICLIENATDYLNPIGGTSLYEKHVFAEKQISLKFLDSAPREYKQYGNDHVPWLSILDVMMFNGFEGTHKMLGEFRLK